LNRENINFVGLKVRQQKMKTKGGHAPGAKDPYMLNVLLAYDNARTCGATLDLLDRISTRLRATTRLNVNAFTFGLLEQMDPCKWKAAAGAKAAELVIVAFGEAGAPGAGLLRWLENWGQCHADKNAAVGLIPMGRATGASVRRTVRALKDTAARHGLDFIYGADSRLGFLQERGTVVA
jgi:hypothetical protein